MLIDIIKKDLKVILTDKKAITILILMPIILTTILSQALSGSFEDGSKIPKFSVAIVKEYDSLRSSEYMREKLEKSIIGEDGAKSILDNISELEFDPEDLFFNEFLENDDLKEIMDYQILALDEANRLLSDNEISAIIILPENFIVDSYISMLTTFRNNVNITVIKNPSRRLTSAITRSIVDGYSEIISSMIIAKNVYISNAIKYDIDNIFSDNLELFLDSLNVDEQPNISVDRIKLNGEEPISSTDYYSVAMMAMFLLFGASEGSVMLLKERKAMTYDRMAVAGLSKAKILISKYLLIFVIALLQMIAMIMYASLILKVDFINIKLVLLTSFSAVFAVAALGMLMGSIMFKAQDYKIVGVMSNGVFQVLALLGGSYIPIEVMPKAMHFISYIPINGLVLKSFLKIMSGYGFKDISLFIALLLLNGVIMFTIAALIFEREVKRC